jgi:hypothetical protein
MAGQNPRTVEEACAFVAHVESLFMPWNIEALLAGFTDDCVVKFRRPAHAQRQGGAPKPVPQPHGAAEGLPPGQGVPRLDGRQDRQFWEGRWEDRVTGAKMQGRGVEIWTMRDGKVAVWEAAFNVNEQGKPSAMGLV